MTESMSGLRQYAVVRVRALLHEPSHYDGWRLNRRALAVGDVATIIEVLHAPGHADGYVAEALGDDGATVWVGEFEADEIEPVDEAAEPAVRTGPGPR